MKQAPRPENDTERIEAITRASLIEGSPRERLDVITRFATRYFKVPISTVTIVGMEKEHYVSCQGLSEQEGERAISFCGHAMLSDVPFVIEDTLQDERFRDNPLVTGPANIRFYAGIPIKTTAGVQAGAFCIKDNKPRKLTEEEIEDLKGLASWAELEINSRYLSQAILERQIAEDKFKNFFNLSIDMMVIADQNGKVLEVNKAYLKLLGYSEAELKGMEMSDYIHPEDVKRIPESLNKISTTGGNDQVEIRIKNKNGDFVWVSWTSALSKDGNIYAVGRDVTEKRKYEQSLEKRTRELEMLNRFMIDRELKMIELKKENQRLRQISTTTEVKGEK